MAAGKAFETGQALICLPLGRGGHVCPPGKPYICPPGGAHICPPGGAHICPPRGAHPCLPSCCILHWEPGTPRVRNLFDSPYFFSLSTGSLKLSEAPHTRQIPESQQSPGQPMSSSVVKGHQRVVTLAQHISVRSCHVSSFPRLMLAVWRGGMVGVRRGPWDSVPTPQLLAPDSFISSADVGKWHCPCWT